MSSEASSKTVVGDLKTCMTKTIRTIANERSWAAENRDRRDNLGESLKSAEE
jgi:hypothetical protein